MSGDQRRREEDEGARGARASGLKGPLELIGPVHLEREQRHGQPLRGLSQETELRGVDRWIPYGQNIRTRLSTGGYTSYHHPLFGLSSAPLSQILTGNMD